jgi:prevent-host-death family protein
MKRIGIRELRQRASQYLRRVQRGETLEITDRGSPIALLVPVPRDGFDRLVAEGRIDAAEGDLLDLGEPLPPAPGVPLPSEILEEHRRDER